MICLNMTHIICCVLVIARTLFTAQTLDLTAFQTKRQQALHNVESTNTFKWELKSYLINKSELDPVQLKNAIEVLTYLLAASSDDVDLVKQSLYALGTIQDINDKTKRSLGNLVMQAIYSINMFEAAFDVSFLIRVKGLDVDIYNKTYNLGDLKNSNITMFFLVIQRSNID